MAYFIKSSIDGITYRRGEFVRNDPVNIDLCKSISKEKFAWYPDNTGKPSIKFHGCKTEWVYDNKQDRDADFERVAANSFKEAQ